jgi:aminoglycoside phosphotransferase (APT) family kinase protein
MEQKLISQGRTAEVFDIGNQQILKLFRRDFPVQGAESEIQIAKLIPDDRLPVPKFFGKVEQDGRVGLIYQKIAGPSMLQRLNSNPLAFWGYAGQMAAIQFEIHQTKVNGLAMQKERLEFFIRHSGELSNDMKERIIEKLKQLKEDYFLCHGDFHPDNILYSTAKQPVVIDWMTATAGNPAGDVARTMVILKYSEPPHHLPLLTRIVLNRFKSLLCHAYLRHYLKLSGMDYREIAAWELPVAAARLIENGPREEKAALLNFIRRQLGNQ